MLPKLFALLGLFSSAGLFTAFLQPSSTYCFSLSREDSLEEDPGPMKLCSGYRAYFNDTRKCYNINSRGPCGEMMVLETSPGTDIGECTCKKSECVGRPTVHWPEENRCYFIFEQGPCPQGQWLVPSKDEGPKCEVIPCIDEYNAQPKPFNGGSVFLFLFQSKCYTTGTPNKGPCSDDEIAYFLGNEHECSALLYKCPEGGTLGAANDCEDGSEADLNGGCEPITNL